MRMEHGQIAVVPENTSATEPQCLVAYLDGPREAGYEYGYSEVNAGDMPETSQVLINCSVEGCNAEIEVFTQRGGIGLASEPTESTIQAARLVCKESRGKM